MARGPRLRRDEGARLLAYQVSDGGSDWTTLRVRDVASGEDLDDVLTKVKFSAATWLLDDRSFLYVHFRPRAPLGAPIQVHRRPPAGAGGTAPVLARIETSAGHRMGKASAVVAAETADLLAFAAEHTGLTPTEPAGGVS